MKNMNQNPINPNQYKHLVGKKIELTIDGEVWVGIADYIGINPIHGKFQVTIDRTPLWPVNPKTIKEVKGEFKNIKNKQS